MDWLRGKSPDEIVVDEVAPEATYPPVDSQTAPPPTDDEGTGEQGAEPSPEAGGGVEESSDDSTDTTRWAQAGGENSAHEIREVIPGGIKAWCDRILLGPDIYEDLPGGIQTCESCYRNKAFLTDQ